MRFLYGATRPRFQVWVSGASLAAWIVLSPIAMLSGLKSALWWITFMSLFANVATCFGWWVSSLVNARAERVEQNTDQAIHFSRIEQAEDTFRAELADVKKSVVQLRNEQGHVLAEILEAVHHVDDPQSPTSTVPSASTVPPPFNHGLLWGQSGG